MSEKLAMKRMTMFDSKIVGRRSDLPCPLIILSIRARIDLLCQVVAKLFSDLGTFGQMDKWTQTEGKESSKLFKLFVLTTQPCFNKIQ